MHFSIALCFFKILSSHFSISACCTSVGFEAPVAGDQPKPRPVSRTANPSVEQDPGGVEYPSQWPPLSQRPQKKKDWRVKSCVRQSQQMKSEASYSGSPGVRSSRRPRRRGRGGGGGPGGPGPQQQQPQRQPGRPGAGPGAPTAVGLPEGRAGLLRAHPSWVGRATICQGMRLSFWQSY